MILRIDDVILTGPSDSGPGGPDGMPGGMGGPPPGY